MEMDGALAVVGKHAFLMDKDGTITGVKGRGPKLCDFLAGLE